MNKFYGWCLILFVSCNASPYMQGKRLYTFHCANCHMDDGSGLSKMIPAIQNSKITFDETFVCLLYHGKVDTVFQNNSYLVKEMPSFKNLSTTEINNIINYVNHTWQHNFKEKSIMETSKELENCKK